MHTRARQAVRCIRVTGLAAVALAGLVACDRGGSDADIYAPAGGCFALAEVEGDRVLRARDGVAGRDGLWYGVRWDAGTETALHFRLQASDLGHYLLYDREAHFLGARSVGGGWQLHRTAERREIRIPRGGRYSDAEWALESAQRGPTAYRLRHLNANRWLGENGLADEKDAMVFELAERRDCADYPELALDAAGEPRRESFADGDLFGIADIHSHLFTNLGFGNSGIFHGAPFHRLGVEHALEDCDEVHGKDGRRDLVTYFLGGEQDIEASAIFSFLEGEIDAYNHATTGYPVFASWPDARNSPTHQVQYHRWLERAWMGGLRLIVQLATGNSVLCELLTGVGAQTAAYSCNDMVSVDHTLDAVRAMERYIDAQAGGPGRGWFRIVESPEDARAIIREGKLAVVLGIEISNLFDCFLTPPPGMPACDRAQIVAEVEKYHARGVRVIFPVHKYDNGFAPGDGQRGALEIGDLLNSGHWGDFSNDCPDFHHAFDRGEVLFGGLNQPRSEYFSAAPLDTSRLGENLVPTLLPLLPYIADPPLAGDWCKSHGLTELGAVLLHELMDRGMVVDIAHLPRRATLDALAILRERRFPAISTHGNTYDGRLYEIGGMSNAGFAGCARVGEDDTLGDPFRARTREIVEATGLPAQPFSFDFNGFAGSRGPRFGPASHCPQPQTSPVAWPFRSFDGQVEFRQPTLGERVVDFNTEGMLHIGLLPELIEDVRRDGMPDAELEPLFRTAESFVRLWEASEAASRH